MNLCRSCGLDFGSVSAFDAHRVGKHAYKLEQGLALGLDDGRRCLTSDELTQRGWTRDSRGRWRRPTTSLSFTQSRRRTRTARPYPRRGDGGQ
jgi:hypothetical protein